MVPDFSRDWLLIKKQSLFADWGTKIPILVPAQPTDSSKPKWVGYILSYRTKDDLGRGIAYDFFGRGEIYKFWGLRDEKLSRAALLVGDTWITFSRLKFTFNFRVYPDGKGGVRGFSIFVYANSDPDLVRFAVSISK